MVETHSSHIWSVDHTKVLSPGEVSKLLKTVEHLRFLAFKRKAKTPVRDWFLTNLALSSGLRVQEMADLNCGDLLSYDRYHFIEVREGKGSRPRRVFVSGEFMKKVRVYFLWKRRNRESVERHAPVFCFDKKRISKRALQASYDRSRKRAGVVQVRGVGIHSLRHTYASSLLQATGNMRLVQQQLGHSSIKTTQVYAHVFPNVMQKAVNKLKW